jgi:maltooligosyltrehalose trehalohydrolase
LNSKLKWEEVTQGKHAEMLAWTKDLIRIRRASTALNDGDLGHIKVKFDETKRWLRMDRRQMSMFANLGSGAAEFPTDDDHRLVLASDPATRLEGAVLSVPPDGFAILSSEPE